MLAPKMFLWLITGCHAVDVGRRRLPFLHLGRASPRAQFGVQRTVPRMMPEGPEVLSLVNRLSDRFGGGRWDLTGAAILSGRYLNNNPPENWVRFTQSLPLRVDHVNCKGKFIFFSFTSQDSEKLTAWSTLGLTGGWSLRRNNHARLALRLTPSSADAMGTPASTASEVLFFYDIRNFGTFKVIATCPYCSASFQN